MHCVPLWAASAWRSIPFVRVADVKDQIEYNACVNIPEMGEEFRTLHMCYPGDVVLTKGGRVGTAGLITQPSYVTRDLIFINASALSRKDYIVLYLFFSSSFAYKQMVRSSSMTAQPHLTITLIRDLLVCNYIDITLPKKGFNQTVTGKIKDACLRLDTALRLRFEYNYRYPHEVDPLAASNSYAIIYQVPFNGFDRLDRENLYATRRGEYAPLMATKAVEWFADYVYALRNALFHEIISPLDEEWQAIFKSAYLLLKQVSDICISCISQIEEFPQTQENAVFEYAEKHKSECFDPLADHVELLDFPKMVLSDWKVEKGKITLRGWFSATLKLQQGDAEAIENGTGSVTTEDKSFDFSITLDDDFKIATDKETQKEIIEIKLQGS